MKEIQLGSGFDWKDKGSLILKEGARLNRLGCLSISSIPDSGKPSLEWHIPSTSPCILSMRILYIAHVQGTEKGLVPSDA